MLRRSILLLLFAGALTATVTAQAFVPDTCDEAGVRYLVHEKLGRIPLKLGDAHPNLRAKYEPAAEGDYIWGANGKFAWSLKIYEFKAATAPVLTGDPSTTEPQDPDAPPPGMERGEARTFEQFVREMDPDANARKFRVEGRADKKTASGEARLWEWTDTRPMTNYYENFAQLWYSCAAVYDIGGREVALVTEMPVKKGDRLERKHYAWAQRMVRSLEQLESSASAAGSDDDELYQFAQDDERRAAIDAALANIAGLQNWGAFTTPNYIVLYSWPKPSARIQYLRDAMDVARDMDAMRELYEEYYPPHEKMQMPYSVMRICSAEDEFHKYSENTVPGVIGWYSPGTKELVLFAGRRDTKTTAFHEGWHQYADAYFPGELHRWFDEGTGDWFGSFERKGSGWDYGVSKMRKVPIKTLVNTDDFVALDQIVKWERNQFYGARAPDYYAQAYALIDFLRRGKERRAYWDPAWESILDRYRTTMLATGDKAKATAAAFEGVDFDAFTKAWVAWVKAY